MDGLQLRWTDRRVMARAGARAMRSAATIVAMTVASVALAQPGADDAAEVAAFAAWAARAAQPIVHMAPAADDRDLRAFARLIARAHVVSFGEGLHGAAEPLEFRNRLFRFLVQTQGFAAIALESGVVEGMVADRWVLGGPGTLDDVMARGFTNGFGVLPQNRALLQWMRDYNADPAHARKVRFFGSDLSGDERDMHRGLALALGYLDGLDAAAAARLRERIADLVPRLTFSRRKAAPDQYPSLTQAERDRLTATIADLIATLEMREVEFARASSDRDYADALRAAVAARRTDDYLRSVPIGWTPADGVASLLGTIAAADRAKMDNIAWMRDRLGHDARVLLFEHRDHLAGRRSTTRMPGMWDALPLPPMVGEALRRRYGRDLVTVAHWFGAEAALCGLPPTITAPGTLERALHDLPPGRFLLDLRSMPAELRDWLSRPRELYGVPPFNTTIVDGAYDAILFTRDVTPAMPCAAGR